MKVKKILLLLVLALAIVLALASCNDPTDTTGGDAGTIINLNSIVVTGIKQLDYISGEMLDITNAKLLLEYDNNEVERIALLPEMIPDYDTFALAKAGAYTVNVIYKNCSTSYTVNIHDSASVELIWAIKPNTTTFTKGTRLSLQGAVLEMKFKSGTSRLIEDIESLVKVSGYNNTVLGNQTITISYAGYVLDLELLIVEELPISIEIAQMPLRTDYFVGDEFELNGLQLKVNYNNETYKTLDVQDLDEGKWQFTFDSSKANSYSVVGFTYYEFSTSFYVKVRFPAFTRMEITNAPVTTGIWLPDGTRTSPTAISEMVLGDKIDYSTGKVRVYFDDGSSTEFKMSDNIIGKRGFEDDEVGQFIMRIYYEGNQDHGQNLTAEVHWPTPVEMILNPEDVIWLQSLSFFKGGVIEEAKIEYIGYSIRYNNGNIETGYYLDPNKDIYQGNLTCDTPGAKTIVFSFGQNTTITAPITVMVNDIVAQSIRIIREPVNTYVELGNDFIINGGQLEVKYNDGSKRTINFEDPQGDVFCVCEDANYKLVVGEYTIKVMYLDFFAEYQIEVKDVVVSNIVISSQGQTKYMQNDKLSLAGIDLYVTYSDDSNQTIPVTEDMLFENHNLYFNGTDYFARVPGDGQRITLRYGGKTTFYYIDVDPLKIDRLELLRAPKLVYRLGIDTVIDLTGIVVKLYYNHIAEDGSEITGIADYYEIMTNSNWSRGEPNLSTSGEKSFALFYTLAGETTSLIFYVQVIETELLSIELDRPIESGMPLNMDLNLEEINLLLYFSDDSIQSTPLLKCYTDYDPNDVTPGERLVTIRYGDCITTQIITLSDKYLVSVTIDTTTSPRTNFVQAENLDLSGGHIRRDFSDGSYDFIAMSDLSIKVSGYNPNIYIGSNGYEDQTVGITYLKYNMSIEVRTHKKLQPQILISGTSVFYGAGIGPEISLKKVINEFELPEFSHQYLVGNEWQTQLPTLVGSYQIKVVVEGNIYYEGGEFVQAELFTIVAKRIVITPDNVFKVSGQDDPEFTYSIEAGALLEGDELTGKLSREEGEAVDTYRITIGTLGNPNYTITLGEAYLTITAS